MTVASPRAPAPRGPLTDQDVVTLSVAVTLLPHHAAQLTAREQRLVAGAGRRFVRDGRLALIRARHWAVVTAASARLRAAEFNGAPA